tara:strand:- start:472 stop:969 length:498 start_codon:yes stop_codon:yes gene_type:complete
MAANQIKIHFYKSPWYMIFAWLIRVVTNSKVNHVSIELPESLGTDCPGIYETKTRGAVKTNLHIKNLSYTFNLPFDPHSANGKKTISFLKKSVAEKYKYDFLGVLLGFFGVKIENEKKYFCSEYVDYAYFELYLGLKNSKLKTNLSPKIIAAKCEAFLWGLIHAK